MEKIGEAGAGFRSLTEHIDTTTPAGRMMMQMVGAFAEFERAMIRERTSAGLPPPGRRAASADGARSWTIPSAARSPRRSSQVGRPQHRWRGCSAYRHRPCRASLPLMWPRVRIRAARDRACRSPGHAHAAGQGREDGGTLYGRASRIMLKGVSAARRTLRKPPAVMTSRNFASPACAPSAAPTSCESEVGTQPIVEPA